MYQVARASDGAHIQAVRNADVPEVVFGFSMAPGLGALPKNIPELRLALELRSSVCVWANARCQPHAKQMQRKQAHADQVQSEFQANAKQSPSKCQANNKQMIAKREPHATQFGNATQMAKTYCANVGKMLTKCSTDVKFEISASKYEANVKQ